MLFISSAAKALQNMSEDPIPLQPAPTLPQSSTSQQRVFLQQQVYSDSSFSTRASHFLNLTLNYSLPVRYVKFRFSPRSFTNVPFQVKSRAAEQPAPRSQSYSYSQPPAH